MSGSLKEAMVGGGSSRGSRHGRTKSGVPSEEEPLLQGWVARWAAAASSS